MGSGSIQNIGLSSLLAAQRALDITGHNIANVNTDGYSRQRIELESVITAGNSGATGGKGVRLVDVNRVIDDINTRQVLVQTAKKADAEGFRDFTLPIDGLLADPNTGVSSKIQSFFDAMQALSSDPSSSVQRDSVFAEADGLARRFNLLGDRLGALESDLSTQLSSDVGELNRLTGAIADLNARVVSSGGSVAARADLLDKRDEVVRQVSELVGVSTLTQEDGSLNIFSANGAALVLGGVSPALTTSSDAYQPTRLEVANADGQTISAQLSGGRIGGTLRFRSELLDPLMSDLGRLAVGMAESLNQQQQKGLDIQGTLGQAFFDSGTPRVSEHVDNTGTGQVTATITDTGQLTNQTYELTFEGGSNFSLTRGDGTVTSINTGGTSPFTTAAVDGFTLTLVAGANVGDRFEISPTATAATNLTLALQNGDQIAAALPVVASVSASNTGSGVITEVNVAGTTNLPLIGAPVSGDLVLSFSSATNQLSLTPDPLGEGPLAFNPATDASGKSFSILGGDVTFVVSGNPADGDQVVLSHNSGAPGDNRNAVAMVALSSERLLDSNRATFQESYGRLVASVGSKTRDAEISSSASGALLDRAVERRASVSGVNLDEEAANLLRYQQAYQASARLFSVADSLFQTLLSSLGR